MLMFRLWAHELGHLAGMHHAAADVNDDNVIDPNWGEYADFSCPMGSEASFKRFNALHRYQMRWLTDANVQVRDRVQAVVLMHFCFMTSACTGGGGATTPVWLALTPPLLNRPRHCDC